MEARVSVTRGANSRRARLAGTLALGALLVAPAVWAADPPKGAESKGEPTKNQCIDANESAQPLRKAGKLREAEARLLVCVRPSCPAVVRDDCAQRLSEVRAAEPTVVFVVRDESDHDLSNVRVTMDGVELAAKLDGTAIAVDPGEHLFVLETDGRLKEARTLKLNEGEKGRQERIVLVAPVVESEAPPAPPPAPETTAPVEPPPPPGRTQRQVGIALGGVGLAGLVVSTIFGVAAKSLYDHAIGSECGHSVGQTNPYACLPLGLSDSQSAHNDATGSTIGFVASGVFIAAGATLYFMAPKGVAVTIAPTVASGGAGLGIGGGW
jgi:hypothetical protein